MTPSPPASSAAASLLAKSIAPDSAQRLLQQRAAWLLPPEPAALRRLLQRAGLLRLVRGQTLLRTDQPTDQVHLLLEGRVHEYRPHGERRVLLQVLRPGDLVGETDALAGEGTPAAADCVAVQSCLLLSLESEALFAAMERSHPLRQAMMLRQIRRLRRANERVRHMATLPAHERILWLLNDAQQAGANLHLPGLSRSEIAGLAGVSREASGRAVCKLVAEAQVVQRGRWLQPAGEAGRVAGAAARAPHAAQLPGAQSGGKVSRPPIDQPMALG